MMVASVTKGKCQPVLWQQGDSEREMKGTGSYSGKPDRISGITDNYIFWRLE